MKPCLKPLSLILLGTAALSACSTTDGQTRSEEIAEILADERVGERVERICFTRGIDSFSNNTEHSVVLRRAVNDEYLVLTRVCPDLDFAQSLALNSRTTSCLREFDEIRVFRSAFGPSRQDVPGFNRCQIDEIYRWDRDAGEEDDSEMEDAEAP